MTQTISGILTVFYSTH